VGRKYGGGHYDLLGLVRKAFLSLASSSNARPAGIVRTAMICDSRRIDPGERKDRSKTATARTKRLETNKA
jgi:hypothetical protein